MSEVFDNNAYVEKMRKHLTEMRKAFRMLEHYNSLGAGSELFDADVAFTETVRAAWEDAGSLSHHAMAVSMSRWLAEEKN